VILSDRSIYEAIASGRLGIDPWLFTVDSARRFADGAAKAGGELVAVENNPLDAVWKAQPPAPLSPIRPQEEHFTGRDSADKRQAIEDILTIRDFDKFLAASGYTGGQPLAPSA